MAGVDKRLDADTPVGFLLSGGLDSSLVCAIAAKKLGRPIRTFAIGMSEDAIDLKYAKQVADYLHADHTEVIINRGIVLRALEDVIAMLGTWDITTIRASVGMYLVCKYIHEHTDIRVLPVSYTHLDVYKRQGIAYESRWTYLLLALVPSVCDCVSAALVYAVARRGTVGRQMALVLAAFTAFDPLLLFDTAVWKQIDGAFTLPLLLCFLLLEQRRYLPAAVWFGLALAIKPQALRCGPVRAACFLAGIALEQDRLRAFGRCFGGAALALLVPLLTGIPFFGLAQLGPRLVEKYTDTMSRCV